MKHILLALFLLTSAPAFAQSLLNLPLADASILGTGSTPDEFFIVPYSDGKGDKGGYTTWSDHGIGGSDGRGGFYWGCHAHWTTIARIKPPTTAGGRATIVEPCGVITNLWATNPGEPNSEKIAGGLWVNGKMFANVYSYYDGNGTAVASLFTGTTTQDLTGMPFTIDTGKAEFKPAMAAQNLSRLPAEWAALFGGNDVTAVGCCKAVIGRDSLGFSLTIFKSSDTPVNGKVPGKWLMGFPASHQNWGPWESDGSKGYNMNVQLGFAFIPNGTRTLVWMGGQGSTWCYGVGQDNPALHNTYDASGQRLCYDPSDHSKGGHGYPLVTLIKFIDLRQLYEVYQGTRQPWDVTAYWTGTLPGVAKGRIIGGSYDYTTGMVYYNFGNTDPEARVFMRKVAFGNQPPPPPACIGTWTTSTTTVPPVCDANQKQTVTDTFTFSETLPAVPGCIMPTPRDPVSRTVDCVYVPPPPPPTEICGDWLDNDLDGLIDEDCTIDVTYTCTAISAPGVYANDKDLKLNTTRCDTNGAVLLKKGAKFTITVTVPKP